MLFRSSQPNVTIAPGHSGSVTLDAQRMTAGSGGYTITGESSDGGITVPPTSGEFKSDGSASITVPITVAKSVPEEYYLVYLTTKVGQSARRSTVFVDVQTPTG